MALRKLSRSLCGLAAERGRRIVPAAIACFSLFEPAAESPALEATSRVMPTLRSLPLDFFCPDVLFDFELSDVIDEEFTWMDSTFGRFIVENEIEFFMRPESKDSTPCRDLEATVSSLEDLDKFKRFLSVLEILAGAVIYFNPLTWVEGKSKLKFNGALPAIFGTIIKSTSLGFESSTVGCRLKVRG